jgi:hypothetical protein
MTDTACQCEEHARIAEALEDARRDWAYDFKLETLKTKVAIAFTTRGNDLYWKTVLWLLNQSNIFQDFSILASVSLWGPGAEQLFEQVTKMACDGVLVVDSDVAPANATLLRLIESGKDIVTCPVWMYDGATHDVHLNCHYDDRRQRVYQPKQPIVGLEKVWASSWGCVWIRKRVLEMFVQAKETFSKWSPILPKELDSIPPDTIFYAKAHALGFDVWMDWSCEFATHHKLVALDSPTLEVFLKRRLFGNSDGENFARAGGVIGRRRLLVPSR